MNLNTLLHQALTSSDITLKESIVEQCFEYCSKNDVMSSIDEPIAVFTSPSYVNVCKIVDPKDLPTRKDFHTNEGLATLIHSILHIEYSAIDLALDAVYRFPDMPQEFKLDWLKVAQDEIRHFKMLKELLFQIGFNYGDFPVHSGLFDASNNTANSIIDRMAVVPRYFEASGLDVNPQIIKKLDNQRKNPFVKELIDVLNIIYDEEIDHVYKGDKWFKYLCNELNKDESYYFEILEKYNLLHKHRPHVNVDARKEAGFTCSEIKKLGAKECD